MKKAAHVPVLVLSAFALTFAGLVKHEPVPVPPVPPAGGEDHGGAVPDDTRPYIPRDDDDDDGDDDDSDRVEPSAPVIPPQS
ncbi:hypothetical protein Srot_0460 [Segniliparus rotundus DSM 44985]|uniref:Secreted protein n=1 Tax=Segniliparus rotundus (strain ATCC BAA-972 / CDC 1076 / CIP 108378 / DSM 44985 / JCM 13578) TaxID=640132 RepID=D6ZBX0_SEGRD|nr:hypothetical protein [Segniliparus rotundus]ADG96947.1 hypothetical protein Srot_0460 [Segniliparus rotundus DSM 44985]